MTFDLKPKACSSKRALTLTRRWGWWGGVQGGLNCRVLYFVWTMAVLNRSFCFFFFFLPPLSSVEEQRGSEFENKGTSCVAHGAQYRPGSTGACGGGAPPVSSCSSAFSKAWLKEFWKFGTGTRSEPSLSPSLSAAGGASSLSAGRQQTSRHKLTEKTCADRKYSIIIKDQSTV